jgi:hypothetical protein
MYINWPKGDYRSCDYGREPTTGMLVGVMPERWIIARQDDELGTLHVHFPRQGYKLTPL